MTCFTKNEVFNESPSYYKYNKIPAPTKAGYMVPFAFFSENVHLKKITTNVCVVWGGNPLVCVPSEEDMFRE